MRKRVVVTTLFCLLLMLAGGFYLALSMNELRPATSMAREDLRIGVVYITPPREINSYSYAHETGISRMREKLDLREDQIMREVQPPSDARAVEYAVRRCIARGAGLIIATSHGYRDICVKLAGEFPTVVFANASGERRNKTNFTNYFGRVYEARYMAGIVAGRRTITNKIGYVAAFGKDNSEVTSGLNAFALGVESVNPKARVHVRVTHRWYDPEGEVLAARQLIEAGCDVLAQHCETPAPQIEAQKAGVWGIGCNTDMRAFAPKAVLTSVIWHFGEYYTRLVQSMEDGTFSTEPYVGGMGDGMVELAPVNNALMPQSVDAELAEVRYKILNNLLHVFEGLLETNEGTSVGTVGKPLDYLEIRGNMHWYYRNIVE